MYLYFCVTGSLGTCFQVLAGCVLEWCGWEVRWSEMGRHPKFFTRVEGCDGLGMGSNSCSPQLLPTTSASSFQLTHFMSVDTGVWPLHSCIEISSHRPLNGLLCGHFR